MPQKKGFWAILDYWNSSWCLWKFFSWPIFEKKAHIWSKRPSLTSQIDGLLSMDTLLNQNIKIYIVNTMLLFTSYHKQVQTFSKIHKIQIQNRFVSEKWPISQKKWSVCENCEYKMPFSELFLKKKTILIWTYFPSGQFWPCIFIR